MLRFGACSICILLVMTLAGCNKPLDLTHGHTDSEPRCELHHCRMQPEYIHISGEACYVLDYIDTANTQFPHHGGHRYNGERDYFISQTKVVDFVCDECDRLYYQYFKNKRQVDPKTLKTASYYQYSHDSPRGPVIHIDTAIPALTPEDLMPSQEMFDNWKANILEN